MAEAHLGTSYVTASAAIETLVGSGVLRETTGQKRNRLYRFDELVALFERQVTPAVKAAADPAMTGS
jgi:hypothetical protein